MPTGLACTPHHLPPGAVLHGKYKLDGVIGEGGFGITYMGWHTALELKVAIKEFYPSGFVTRETAATHTVTPMAGPQGEYFVRNLARFVDEAKRLARCRNMQGIVDVQDFFEENGTAYIVMEYIDGQTFGGYLKSMGGRLPAGQVFEMMRPVMRTLGDIHEAGMIHRDISPENIKITRDGYMKLLDFGAARDFGDDNRSMSILLRHGYSPLEQYQTRGRQGPWTDVYALCAVMYRAVTGQRLADAPERVEEDLARPPSALGIAIDPAQEAALMRGLALFGRNRTASMAELMQGLGTLPGYTIAPSVTPEPESERHGPELSTTLPVEEELVPPPLQKPKAPAPLLALGAAHGIVALLALLWGGTLMAAADGAWSLLYFPFAAAYMVAMYLLGTYQKGAVIPLGLTAAASAVICLIREYELNSYLYRHVNDTAGGIVWWLLLLVPLYAWTFHYLLRDRKYIAFRDAGAAWLKAQPKLPRSGRAFLGLHAFMALLAMALSMLPVAEYEMGKLLKGDSLVAGEVSLLLLGFLGPVLLAAFLSLLALLRKREKAAWAPLAAAAGYGLLFFMVWSIGYFEDYPVSGSVIFLLYIGLYAWPYFALCRGGSQRWRQLPRPAKNVRAMLGAHGFLTFAALVASLGFGIGGGDRAFYWRFNGIGLDAEETLFLWASFLGIVWLAAFVALMILTRRRNRLAWVPLAVGAVYGLVCFICWCVYDPVAGLQAPAILAFMGIYAWSFLALPKPKKEIN